MSTSNLAFFGQGREILAQLQEQEQQPILVKFVAPHCPSCETLTSLLESLVAEQAGRIFLVTIDIIEDPELAIELGVRSAPTVIALKGKTILERWGGLKPKKIYKEAIAEII